MAISLCVVGATGRFGRLIISQAATDFTISGAIASDSNPNIGKTLSELGLQSSETRLKPPSQLEDAAANSDVILSVSKAEADLLNMPRVVALKKRVVVGTTGFTAGQSERLNSLLKSVPALVSSNFSVGANILFQITDLLSRFNKFYDYSIIEEHHKMKADAPSGTAKTMLQLLNQGAAVPTVVTDRTARPKRMDGEVEVAALRGGGTPGIHQLILSGEHDMIKVEHVAFSRAAMATGAMVACRWLAAQEQPGIYSMRDVLGLRQGRFRHDQPE